MNSNALKKEFVGSPEEPSTSAERPSVFNYENYRLFLRDLYGHHKIQQRSFSYRYFSKQAGFQAPNFLKLVIEGQRNLSEDSVEKFARGFKLSREETQYFKNLVEFDQASDSGSRAIAAEKITKNRFARKVHPLRESQYNYYSKWYLIAIRELVALKHFQDDPQWIAANVSPQISDAEAQRAMEDLETLGLIRKDPAGRWVQNTENVSTADEVSSSSVVLFHREMMSRASESIDRFVRDERDISSVTLTVTPENAKLIKEMIQDFRREILRVASRDGSVERVYQLNFQLFPLTEKPGGDS